MTTPYIPSCISFVSVDCRVTEWESALFLNYNVYSSTFQKHGMQNNQLWSAATENGNCIDSVRLETLGVLAQTVVPSFSIRDVPRSMPRYSSVPFLDFRLLVWATHVLCQRN